jgi:predicted RNase H-like nuclease (RuvC/YqgF family)
MNTIRKICKMEGIIYDRAVAHDLDNLERYPSKSKEKDLNILDMNLGHVLRSFSKTLAENKELKEELSEIKSSNKELKEELSEIKSSTEYKRGWNTAYNQIRNALFDTDMSTPKPMK